MYYFKVASVYTTFAIYIYFKIKQVTVPSLPLPFFGSANTKLQGQRWAQPEGDHLAS